MRGSFRVFGRWRRTGDALARQQGWSLQVVATGQIGLIAILTEIRLIVKWLVFFSPSKKAHYP